ncbi:hypothetical protein GCM10011494_36370 [Novosphingobium endophyticum]|uniref:PilZ domain-containing protein n=1 Tax=Novosphingobium endophyticum TaxID=1955250 RepID=A0A916TW74_9SPHN|nr:PilZ domain-containing protein [Novosphingobium endophyticum]GGC14271.1 hypothetical protein GCM10011494_36370 [Novosphingobium endophyticum]
MPCEQSAYASVGARHVSAEGCQFVVEREMPAKGERFAFHVDGRVAVTGTVRWVVSDRIGFAFDRLIDREMQTALLARSQGFRGIEIYPVSGA